jgi:hypothetical protein
MRNTFLLLVIASCLMVTCKNLETADPAPRSTFTKFYEGPYSMQTMALDKIPDGFVLLANTITKTNDGSIVQTVLIETDENGNQIGDFHSYDNIVSKSFKAIVSNGAVNGYVVVGDSIYTDPTAEQAANVVVSSMSVLILNSSFQELKRIYITDKKATGAGHPVKDDFFGESINLTGTGGVIILGTFKEGIVNQQNAPAEQLLFGLNTSLDSAWVKFYPLLSNTYANAKSIHYSNGNIIWASAIADVQGDFTNSYVTVPFVKEQSVPVNFSTLGQSTNQKFLPKDIQPAASPDFGFGVVGTYSLNPDGSEGNIFFFRVGTNGSIIPGSDRYFDGNLSLTTPALDKNTSEIIDEGEAITGTRDGGFVLVGTVKSNPDKNLLVIKVNALGDLLWMKTLGGSGDEIPVSVTEASNGDILIGGTNDLKDYASAFLMRMDKNGDLKN